MGLFRKKKKIDWLDKFHEDALIENQERIRGYIDRKLRYSKTSPLNYFRTYAGYKIYSNTYIFVVQFHGQPEFEIEMIEDDMCKLAHCEPKLKELVQTIRQFFKIVSDDKFDEYGLEG